MGSPIIINYGLWIYNIIVLLQPVILSGAATLLPIIVTNAIARFFISQSLSNAINAGLASVESAVKGQTLSVSTSNEVINTALAWLMKNEPDTVAYYGTKLRDYLIAELSKAGSAPVRSINRKD